MPQPQRLASASARGQGTPPESEKGRGWQQYLHLLQIHLLTSFFGRTIFDWITSVTQDAKVQLHKQLHQCKQGGSKLWGTWGQRSPLGQPHHRSHHAVTATTTNTGALERLRREEASLSHLSVQMWCSLQDSSWLSGRSFAFAYVLWRIQQDTRNILTFSPVTEELML